MSFLNDLFGGGSQSPGPTTNVQTSANINPVIQPFVEEVLGEAQKQFQTEEFKTFPGPRIADFTAPQQKVFSGIESLVDVGLGATPNIAGSGQLAQQAQQALEQATQQTELADIQRLMNPYQQAVIDIQKREAERDFEGSILPQIGAQAAGSRAFGGSRQALLESEARRNLDQRLADIQATGSQQAYNQALAELGREKARQQAGAGLYGTFAQQFPQQALRELGVLEAVGETQQQRDQRVLDIALSDFLSEEAFPGQQLARYAGLVRGFPVDPTITRQEVSSIPTPSLGQQLLGLGGTALQTAALAGAFGAGGGQIGSLPRGMQSGGQIQGGLASLERHQNNKSKRRESYKRNAEMVKKAIELLQRHGIIKSTGQQAMIEFRYRIESDPNFKQSFNRAITSVARGEGAEPLQSEYNIPTPNQPPGEPREQFSPRGPDPYFPVDQRERILNEYNRELNRRRQNFYDLARGHDPARRDYRVSEEDSDLPVQLNIDELLALPAEDGASVVDAYQEIRESHKRGRQDFDRLDDVHNELARIGFVGEESQTGVRRPQVKSLRINIPRTRREHLTSMGTPKGKMGMLREHLTSMGTPKGEMSMLSDFTEVIPAGPGGAGTRIPEDEFIPHGPDEGGLSRLPFEILGHDERGGTRLHTSRDYPALRREGTDMRYPARTFEESLQEFEPAGSGEGGEFYDKVDITGILEAINNPRGGRQSSRLPKELRGMEDYQLRKVLRAIRNRKKSGGQIKGGLSSLERHQDIGNSFIERTREHDPMARTLTEQMIQKAKLLNQGVSEEVADRIVVSMQNPELKGTGASGDPLIMEQKALEEIRERRAREADRIGKNVSMTGAGKEYLDEVKRVGESGRSYELAKRGYQPTEKYVSPYGLQDLSKRPSDQNQGFAQETNVEEEKIKSRRTDAPDSKQEALITPSTRHTTEAWNKVKEYESEARRLGDEAAAAATAYGNYGRERANEQIEVSEGIFNRGKELLEKGEVDFKTFMDDRTSVMTDIYNKGLERINKIEDESQRRIAQDETNNLFGFIGTVLANQVNDPRGALVGIATASAEAFPEHAERQHKLSKESRDMVKEIEGLRGEADAEYARQGLKTKELNYKEQVRLDKELYTMRNNLEMNKVTFKTEGEKALYEGKMRALEAKIAALGATNTTINTALEIAKIEDDRYNSWLDRQVEIGKMNEEQRAASVKFMNDVSLDSTERMLMIDSLRSSFGDQIETDGKGGIALIAEIGSDAQQALAALQGAVARAKQIYGRVGHVKEGTPMNVRIKGEDVQIPLREGYAMNIGDIYDQISPYFAGGSETSGRSGE